MFSQDRETSGSSASHGNLIGRDHPLLFEEPCLAAKILRVVLQGLLQIMFCLLAKLRI